MRKIAIVNQKGGVGKTTTAVNLGAALTRMGKRVALVDLDPQANLTLHVGLEISMDRGSTYSLICGESEFEEILTDTPTAGLRVAPSNIDLSGAELELAARFGRESLLRERVLSWERACVADEDKELPDYLFFDCPPSLGLLSINGLVAADEVFIALQTEFFALQGMSKLVEIVQLLQRNLNPDLLITGIVPCLYDSRLKLAREVLGEIRKYFPGQVFRRCVGTNVKLAEAPSYGQTIFEYAPDSNGARDYALLAEEVLGQERAPSRPLDDASENGDGSSASGEGSDLSDLEVPAERARQSKGEVLRARDLPELPPEAFRMPTPSNPQGL